MHHVPIYSLGLDIYSSYADLQTTVTVSKTFDVTTVVCFFEASVWEVCRDDFDFRLPLSLHADLQTTVVVSKTARGYYSSLQRYAAVIRQSEIGTTGSLEASFEDG